MDDDVGNGRMTGYAIANTGSNSIAVSASEVSGDGRTATTLTDIQLAPGQQKAAFVFQDPRASQIFRGSLRLTGQNGATFAAVALVINRDLLTAIPVVSANAGELPAVTFAQVAIGGGYSTLFTLLNTGDDTLEGDLVLTGQDGKPLNANMAEGGYSRTDSRFPVTVPSGGTKFVMATASAETDPAKVGWATVSNAGGVLGGAATFQLTSGNGELQTIAGVLSSASVSAATMPVDDDVTANRFTGYAIANPNSTPITITVMEVSANGLVVTALKPLIIQPRGQVAHFLFQDPKASPKIQGSAVFVSDNGVPFSIVGLVQTQGLITAIPVVRGKAPNIYIWP